MANPIQTSSGKMAQLPPHINQEQSSLKGTAQKVSLSVGGSQKEAIVKTVAAIAPSNSGVALAPDPQKVIGAVKKASNTLDLVALLALRAEMRGSVLTCLSNNDLEALEKALGKNVYTSEFRTFHKQSTDIQQHRILQEMLADHPDWKKEIEACPGASIEDKVWLFHIYELRPFVDVLQSIRSVNQKAFSLIRIQSTKELLQPNIKADITAALNNIKHIDWSGKKLKKCPRAICLFRNLQTLTLFNNELTVPPNLSENLSLREVNLGKNKLTAPPDVRCNVNLERLNLYDNPLTSAPDISKNPKLTLLDLKKNPLSKDAREALDKMNKEQKKGFLFM